MHRSPAVGQKQVLIKAILLCILSVPLATSPVFDTEHSYDKYLWKEGKERGHGVRRRERREKRDKSVSHLWECQLKHLALLKSLRALDHT